MAKRQRSNPPRRLRQRLYTYPSLSDAPSARDRARESLETTLATSTSHAHSFASASAAVSPVALVASVPQYHTSLSLPSLDESEETEYRDRSYAALFKTEVTRLKDGKPSGAHQRLLFITITIRSAIRRSPRGVTDTRADHVWADLYSLMVLGTDIRFIRWDRQGLSVTHKVDYVKDTRTFVELLLEFVVLDASQGICHPAGGRLAPLWLHGRLDDGRSRGTADACHLDLTDV